MNLADIPASRLVQPGSRVRYVLLLAGDPSTIDTYREAAEKRLNRSTHMHTVRDARPEFRSALHRAEQFLSLAALMSVLLAGGAVAMASRAFAERRMDGVALMRCFGASQALVMRTHLLAMLILGLLASLVGCLVGGGLQWLLANLLGSLFLDTLPAPGGAPIVAGIILGIVTLLGFGLPPLMQLRQVPPARVLRRELGPPPPAVWSVYGGALAAIALLVVWQANDTRLALYVLGGAALTLVVLGAGASFLVSALTRLRGRVGVSWRFGLANVARRPRSSIAQVVAFGLGIMALLLLTLVRTDLLEQWRRNLPSGAPNYFLINVQPDEAGALKQYLTGKGLPAAALYPMIRGRLIAINGDAVDPSVYSSPRAQRLAAREFNLSWAADLPSDNQIVAGQWWTNEDEGGQMFSVEQGLAETLGIAMNDQLRFQIAGQDVAGRVASLRTVEWDSFRVNFFVVAPPGWLDDQPATYVTSFHLPAAHRKLLPDLAKRFPSVTILDVEALMTKVRQLMDQATRGIEIVFAFTLLAGVCVLYAALQSTLDERRRETAVLRTLGADRRRVARGLMAEFAVLGLMAGILAAFGATAVGHVIALRIFDMQLALNPWIWLYGVAGGTVGVTLAGALGLKPVLDRAPLRTLQEF
ncbi:MAG: ABC transporter permease [Gammaproteobacteria bacterium]|nr:MAG: ABC transporter permease [Gammaproteobacteria bacterium]